MTHQEYLEFMAELKNNILDYLKEQLAINEAALRPYEEINPMKEQEQDPDSKRHREYEAMRLRILILDLKKHIAVIEKMIPPPMPKKTTTNK